MDNLTFISKITSSLIWPVVVIGALYVLRTPISKLVPKVTRVKFKDLEADFQGLSVTEQSLLFLDGVARKGQWTFYEQVRPGERALGQAFLIIVADLLNVERNELVKILKQWMTSEDENLVWFASEVVGYFKIYELKNELFKIVPVDTDKDLRTCELNALWAYSRITGFSKLANVLLSTTSKSNQEWLLFVYEQMPDDSAFPIENRIVDLEEFIDRDSLDNKIVSLAKDIVRGLKSPNKANSADPIPRRSSRRSVELAS